MRAYVCSWREGQPAAHGLKQRGHSTMCTPPYMHLTSIVSFLVLLYLAQPVSTIFGSAKVALPHSFFSSAAHL